MRFVVSGDLNRNRLLQVIIVLYSIFVIGLWLSNALLYFSKMGLTPGSVIEYYLGSPERFLSPRSYQGMLEVSHFHLFAMGMLLLVLTHLILFIRVSQRTKLCLIVLPFLAALLEEGAGWGIRFVDPRLAIFKIAGFVLLEGSLGALIGISLWSVFCGTNQNYRAGIPANGGVEVP